MEASNDALRVLLIEDNPGDALLVAEYLAAIESSQFETIHVDTLSKALAELASQVFDLVLLDLNLPDANRLEGLYEIRPQVPDVLLIVLTGSQESQLALEALHVGAQDYLLKDEMSAFNLERSIAYARERASYAGRMLEAEKQRLQLIRQLEQQGIISKLVADIAHEFRTALTEISTSAYIWAKRSPSEFATKYQGHIDDSTRFLLETVNYMGLITRYTQSLVTDQVTALQPFLIKDFEPRYNHGGRLVIRCETDCTVAIGADALEHVLEKVVDNALHFSDSDKPVTVTVTADDSVVKIAVRDEGIGIPADALEKIFLPFYKVRAARTHLLGAGTGLGLTVAHAIVSAHQGVLKVASELQQGTTVTICLLRVHSSS